VNPKIVRLKGNFFQVSIDAEIKYQVFLGDLFGFD